MRIKDYFGAVGSKPMVFGLAWDVTDGVNIDLDASAIMLANDQVRRPAARRAAHRPRRTLASPPRPCWRPPC